MKSLTLSHSIQCLIIFSLSILPLFFLPITGEFYETNKWYLLAFTALIVTGLWIVQSFQTGNVSVHFSPSARAFGLLALSALISLLIASPNKTDAVLSLYGVVPFASIFFLLLFGEPSFTKKGKSALKNLWFLGASGAGLLAVYQFFSLGKLLSAFLPFLSDPLWTPLGSSIALVSFLLLPLPLLLEETVQSMEKKEETKIAVYIAFLLLIGAGLTVTLVQIIPKFLASFLPYSMGWTIMMEGLKDMKRSLAGVGVENFLFAFSSGKPAGINATPLWSLRFITSSSFILHIVTVFGFLGAGALVALVKSLISSFSARNRTSPGITGSIFLSLALLFLLPPNFITLVLLLSLSLLYHEPGEHTKTYTPSPTVSSSLLIALILCVGLGFYGLGRSYASEVMFNRSLVAAREGNGTNAYNFQRDAIILMPSVTRYHSTYAQTNLALANSLALAVEKQGKIASDSAEGIQQAEDRKLITTLIQQSIEQAKVATALAPENVNAWENLGQTYISLMGVAGGAESWAVASYEKAIQLEPMNPMLRVTLGSIHIRQKNYNEALSLFSGAIALKPDYANGYYNLANAYRLKGDRERAILAYEQTIQYTAKDASDLDKVKTELQSLKNEPASSKESLPPTQKP